MLPPPTAPPWEELLATAFPGWLLPHSCRRSISTAAAARFLERLTGRSDHLRLLQATALLSAERETVARLVRDELPALVRCLPARAQVVQRTWEGAFHGRLDLAATARHHSAGHTTRFVTRSRRRDLALPENLLLKRVCVDLMSALQLVLDETGGRAPWAEPLREAHGPLRWLLHQTNLRQVPTPPRSTGHQLRAAEQATLPAYRTAAWLSRRLQDAFSEDDPQATAALLGRGALWPLNAETRFELAVLVRLIDRLAQVLGVADPSREWSMNHGLISSGRDEVVTFQGPEGRRIRVWYNSAPGALRPGRRHALVRHYLGASRQRPDIVLSRERPGQPPRWAVVEVKCSTHAGYQRSGLDEALLYGLEYGEQLAGWPQAIVVVPDSSPAPLLDSDPVVLQGWSDWPHSAVLRGLVDGLSG